MERGSQTKANGYPQELEEVIEAALILTSLKHAKLDQKTASQLHDLKSKTLETTKRVAKEKSVLEENVNNNTQIMKKVKKSNNSRQNLPGSSLIFLPEDCNYKPPAIPPVSGLNGLIGICSKPFEKQLTDSDIRIDQSRLAMRKSDVRAYLLPLLEPEENPYEGIPVTTYDFDGNAYQMEFKIWVNKIHVLTSGWKKFCEDHGLVKHQDFVTVWMFRHVVTENLCFVVNSRRLQVFEPLKRIRGR